MSMEFQLAVYPGSFGSARLFPDALSVSRVSDFRSCCLFTGSASISFCRHGNAAPRRSWCFSVLQSSIESESHGRSTHKTRCCFHSRTQTKCNWVACFYFNALRCVQYLNLIINQCVAFRFNQRLLSIIY